MVLAGAPISTVKQRYSAVVTVPRGDSFLGLMGIERADIHSVRVPPELSESCLGQSQSNDTR